ncbi:MAG TPA: class I SAM-dependent methyltransferase [Gallionella sp.]|nr:class I SAM-dependent methyltransferase [Gallionella sp.]
MATVADHYKTHLAPVYVWMAGGFDAAVSRGETEIQTIFPILSGGITAVDLGAGFGMHSIPLARRGCPVIAIDTSALLLEELKGHAEALPVKAVEDDLLSFQRHLDSKVNLILCMGDTLTHLPDLPSVERLFSQAAESLRSAGIFVITFRNYTTPLLGNDRFIPVKSDADRILTCFLEYEPGRVDVHDLLHERIASSWQLRVSTYRKLRFTPEWVSSCLQTRGFSVLVEPGLGGMVRIVATRS